jgi:hypothetical protein
MCGICGAIGIDSQLMVSPSPVHNQDAWRLNLQGRRFGRQVVRSVASNYPSLWAGRYGCTEAPDWRSIIPSAAPSAGAGRRRVKRAFSFRKRDSKCW